jgi:DNA-binding phage protein
MVDEAEICTRMANGGTKAQVARDMGVSRMTIYRALQTLPPTEDESA